MHATMGGHGQLKSWQNIKLGVAITHSKKSFLNSQSLPPSSEAPYIVTFVQTSSSNFLATSVSVLSHCSTYSRITSPYFDTITSGSPLELKSSLLAPEVRLSLTIRAMMVSGWVLVVVCLGWGVAYLLKKSTLITPEGWVRAVKARPVMFQLLFYFSQWKYHVSNWARTFRNDPRQTKLAPVRSMYIGMKQAGEESVQHHRRLFSILTANVELARKYILFQNTR